MIYSFFFATGAIIIEPSSRNPIYYFVTKMNYETIEIRGYTGNYESLDD